MSNDDTINMNDEATTDAAPKVTIGSVASAAIMEGASNEEALAAVKEVFPNAKTSASSINWYRNNLRTLGHPVLTARDLKKQRAAETATDETATDDTAAEDTDSTEVDPLA